MVSEAWAKATRDDLVEWLRWYFNGQGAHTKAVIGISGGKDSTILAALLVRAIGAERVIGVQMPNGTQSDICDSNEVFTALGLKPYYLNIGAISEVFYSLLGQTFPTVEDTEVLTNNLPPRVRMTMLYGVANMINGRVINTSNMSEYYIGYFTRWGDECGDIKPLIQLTCTEVIAIGKTLDEIPLRLIEKKPSDGLSGKTDEDRFGFTYEELDTYLVGNTEIDIVTNNKIEAMRARSEFKRNNIPYFIPRCSANEKGYSQI